MSMLLLTEWFCAIVMIVTGLSHIAAPRQWAQLFKDVFQREYAGLIIGLPTFMLGLAIVLLHNNWGLNPGLIVTIVGWAWMLKGALYLLAPSTPARIGRAHMEHPRRFVAAGAILAALGAAVIVRLLLAVSDAPIR